MGSKPEKTVRVTITAEVSHQTAEELKQLNRTNWHRTRLHLDQSGPYIPAYDLTMKIGK